jgi:hypothetical protein
MTDEKLATVPESEVEVDAFWKLICAMYIQPYLIEDVSELLVFVRLADYYCCLPVVSGTLSGALLGSPIFKRRDTDSVDDNEGQDFAHKAGELIFAAKKLRHPVLFRECFIHLVANLHDKNYMVDDLPALRGDKDLWLLLNEAKSSLRQRILAAQHEVLTASLQGNFLAGFKTLACDKLCDNSEESAYFFRCLLEHREDVHHHQDELEDMFSFIENLLRNNLVFDQTDYGAGEGPYEFCFLSAELADEDMPWDVTEVDW